MQLVYGYTLTSFMCEPELNLAQLYGRRNALDSPGTPGIRVPSPVGWGRKSVRQLREQRRRVLGDSGGSSIITATHFPLYE